MSKTKYMTKLVQNSETEETYLLRCECYTHLLTITAFKEDLDMDDPIVYMDIQDLGSKIYSWFGYRIGAAWNALRHGQAAGKEMVLPASAAIEVGEKLVKLGLLAQGYREASLKEEQ